ncbi:MAG: CRISPR-associated endonuclease Cas3'', partial [Thiohalospira sp.]
RGFVPGNSEPVAMTRAADGSESEGYGSDTLSHIGRRVPLPEHLADVAAAMAELGHSLERPPEERALLETAARWHDVGKAHEAFQRGLGFDPATDAAGPWAKSDRSGRPDYHRLNEEGEREDRPGFRHELASALAWLERGGVDREPIQRDRIAYLIAAHHGRVRLGLRALPDEQEPPDPETLFARGVWAGDALPALDFDGEHLEPVTLRLDLMRLGSGPQGPSWSERTHRLLDELGPFRLAWEEALVRIADWRASAREAEQ